MLTTHFVLSETLTLLRYRFGLTVAEALWNAVQDAKSDGLLEIHPLNEELWQESLAVFFKYRDQNFSIVDCTSFALTRRVGIDTAFAFDHHFWVRGFVVEPASGQDTL